MSQRGIALLLYSCAAFAQENFFEAKVQPVLRANCLACHSEKALNSGLSVETRESLLKGGNRGAAVKAGAPDQSLLIHAIKHSGDVKMPPGRKLKDEQIAILEEWVKQGVPMPAALQRSRRPGADHWAFQPPTRHPLPTVRNASWLRNPIDQFILARLEKVGLKPAPEANAGALFRRAGLDLTGLPPTGQEMRDYLADKSAGAYERAVDRMLASPHYGERWGRDWLDIARYADSDGYTIDAPREMWLYRDWVINSLNQDMPFDQFIIEQFAGDLLPNPTTQQLIATGFHRNTPSNYEGGIDFEQYRVEAVADRVNTTGAALMGLSLGCARCHDHKYDPISQREYYQLFAFLNSIDEIDKEADRKDFNRPFLAVGDDEQMKRYHAWEKQVDLLEREVAEFKQSIGGLGDSISDPGTLERQRTIDAVRKRLPRISRTLIMREMATPRQAYIHLSGDFTRKGANVEPGVPSVFPPLNVTGRPTRLDFARWLVDKRQPLTARVTMNRLWQKYFGKGIVDTENDLGATGERPTHPELLDWLAIEFMDQGWSMKAMHKRIVMSAAYRQSSAGRADAKAVDPDNRLLARQNRLRLDAENIRDSALVASGLLSRKVGGPSVYPPLPAGANSVTQVQREWKVSKGEDKFRRGIYTYFQRSAPHPGLVLFDAPDATVTCTRRLRSNSPLQALTLLNDDAYIEFAGALADRLMAAGEADDAGKLKRGFVYAMNREPAESEQSRLLKLLAAQRDAKKDEKTAWTAVSRVLLNLDEFLTRE